MTCLLQFVVYLSAECGDYSFSLCIQGEYVPFERLALHSVSLMSLRTASGYKLSPIPLCCQAVLILRSGLFSKVSTGVIL